MYRYTRTITSQRISVLTAGIMLVMGAALTAGCGGGGSGFSSPNSSTQGQVAGDTTGTAGLATAPLGSAIGSTPGSTNPYGNYNGGTTPIGSENPTGPGVIVPAPVNHSPVDQNDPNGHITGK